MIADALDGKIDLIVTKSVSRFARNTEDSLTTVRHLKGVNTKGHQVSDGKGHMAPGYSGVSIFSSKIKCGDCGAYYGSKVWHSNDKYRRVIYRCNNKYKGCTCQTPHVTEEEVKEAFIKALNELLDGKDEILANVQLIKRTLCNTTDLEKQKNALEQELDVIVDMTQNTISENAKVVQDQSDYQERYEGLIQRYDSVKESLDKIVSQIADRKARAASFTEFSKELKKRDGVVAEFDERLWGSLVECVTIGKKKEMVFRFRDGTEITIQG